MNERIHTSNAHILSGRYDPEFARKVAESADLPFEMAQITQFSNGEVKAEVPTAVRDDYVFVIQSHGSSKHVSINDTIAEHIAMISAANNASAAKVIAVNPYKGYGRADRPDGPHESFMGPLIMRALEEAGMNAMIEIDPHAGQSAGFFKNNETSYIPIPSSPVIQQYITDRFITGEDDKLCIVSPDAGRAKLNRRYADHFDRPLVIVDKNRTGANQTKVMRVIGSVAGLHCVMIDDMIDTGGTIIEGAQALKDQGAESVTVVATHGLFSGPAIERFVAAKESGVISNITVTDTLRLPKDTPEGLIEVISVASLVGDAIRRVFHGQSVSDMYQ